MSSRTRRAQLTQKKRKATVKGIIRKSENGRNILIIIGNVVYFVSFNALMNVWNDVRETTPILGY